MYLELSSNQTSERQWTAVRAAHDSSTGSRTCLVDFSGPGGNVRHEPVMRPRTCARMGIKAGALLLVTRNARESASVRACLLTILDGPDLCNHPWPVGMFDPARLGTSIEQLRSLSVDKTGTCFEDISNSSTRFWQSLRARSA